MLIQIIYLILQCFFNIIKMKKNFKILYFLLLSAMVVSCASLPRTMGPYIEAEARTVSAQNNQNQPNTQQNQQNQQQQKAQQPKQQQNQSQKPQSVQKQPTVQQQQSPQQNYEPREEVFSMVSISDAIRLKSYNIVVGSYSVHDNAKKMAQSLQPDYLPIIVINERGMFRVIISSFDNYDTAKEELSNSIKQKFPDAWILTQKR